MKLNIFAVYDTKAKFYRTPFMLQSKGEAIRGWSDVANDEKTEYYKHGEDFCLFQLGEFDTITGKIESSKAPESIGLAMEFRNVDMEKN